QRIALRIVGGDASVGQGEGRDFQSRHLPANAIESSTAYFTANVSSNAGVARCEVPLALRLPQNGPTSSVGKWDSCDDWDGTWIRDRPRDADRCAFLDVASGVGAAGACRAAAGGGRLLACEGCGR